MSRFLLALILSSFLMGPALAQDANRQWGNKESVEVPYGRDYQTFQKLLNGEQAVTKADQAILDVAAKYFVYRLTWLQPTKDQALTQFDNLLMTPLMAKFNNNKEFRAQFGKVLALRLQDVIYQDLKQNRATCLHAALLLPKAAKLKSDDVTDLLVEIIKDKNKHDAIKLYALQGLREAFPIRVIIEERHDNLTEKEQLEKKKDLERIEVLHDYMTRKWSGLELEAVRQFLRKEAISSLAQAQGPAVTGFKRSPKGVEGPAAYFLMKPLLKGMLFPEPALEEKIEAALGLLQMRTDKSPDYEPGWGLYLAGQAILEVASEYNKDWTNFAGGVKEKKVPILPWKTNAERFKQALEEAVKLNRAGDHAKLYQSMAEKALPVLAPMAKYQRLDPEPVANLRAALEALKPKTGALFKDVKGSPTITLGE